MNNFELKKKKEYYGKHWNDPNVDPNEMADILNTLIKHRYGIGDSPTESTMERLVQLRDYWRSQVKVKKDE